MVQKITNLDTEVSSQQIDSEWSQLLAIRNRLLEVSDWTQLNDVFLTPVSKRAWGVWRQKLRRVKRKTFNDIKEATSVLDLLKKEMPKDNPLDESEFQQKVVDAEITPEKIVYKTTIKEQPIILREIIEEEKFNDMLKAALNSDAYGFKQYLNSFLHRSNTNIFLDSDVINDAQVKAKAFLAEQVQFALDRKLKSLPDIRILNQRADEALHFLTVKDAKVEDFPLIGLQIEVLGHTAEEVALNFLRQKKWYNALLLESDKFLTYNTKAIDDAIDISKLKAIIENIKNGY